MKHLFSLFILLCVARVSCAQTVVQTDTIKGFSSANSAVLSMVFNNDGAVTATFSNGSKVNMNEALNLNMKGFNPTFDQILITCIAYMNQRGFRLVSSFTIGDYHTRHIFEHSK